MHVRDRLPVVSTRSLALVAVSVVAVALTVPVQLAWLIAFDGASLDAVVPDLLWLVVGPAATTTVPPVAAARRWFGRSTAVRVGVVAFVAAAAVAVVTMDAYTMCGPC